MTAVEASLAGKRCLVLDDEFLIALDIQQILETAGAAEVVCFGDAAEARAALEDAAPFDVAVLDVHLVGPERSSLSVATALAERGTPFVFLTGMRGDDVHAGKLPTAPVVEKPYEASNLLTALARALAKKHARRMPGMFPLGPKFSPMSASVRTGGHAAVCHCAMTSLDDLLR